MNPASTNVHQFVPFTVALRNSNLKVRNGSVKRKTMNKDELRKETGLKFKDNAIIYSFFLFFL